jgi:hypothetical protein
LAALGLGLIGGVGELAAQDVSKDKPVELPTYTVQDSRELPPPETWYYGRIAGFEILSNGSQKETKRLVEDFQRFNLALALVWPGAQRPAAVPTTLIICGRGGQFDKFLAGDQKKERATSTLTFRKAEQSAIVLDLQTKVLNLDTPEGVAAAAETAAAVTEESVTTGGAGNPGFRVDAYRQLYRQYVRFLLSGAAPRGPAWFEEGLAQILMGIEVTGTSIVVGKLANPNEISSEQAALNDVGVSGTAAVEDRDFNAVLARRRLLSMEDLFAVEHDAPEANRPLGGTWAKQACAFVHWGLYGNQGKHQKDFLTFLKRLEREPASDALFKDCFKQSYKEMGFTLRSYIEMTDYKIAGVEANKGQKLPIPPPFELREATEPEVGRLKGEALLLAGNTAEARLAITTPFIRGERDPQLLASLGLLEHAAGDDVKARKILEAAAAGKATRPRAYLELARLRFAEAATKPAESHDRFNAQQTAAVLTPLFTARAQPPPLPEIYELIGEVWSRSAVTPGADHLGVLDEGVRFFPRNTRLIYLTASQKVRAGLIADARQVIEYSLRAGPDTDSRQKLEMLKASLPAPSK